MQTTNTNKYAMAGLGTLLLTMGLVVITNGLFSPRIPAKAGYELPGASEAKAATPDAGAKEEPLAPLLAKADAAKGQADAKACQACHDLSKGGVAKIGPPLWGVIGRPVASIAGFAYSDAIKAHGGNWDYEGVNKMIANPKTMIPGTKMAYPGEADPHKRADILAYLQTLSDAPVAFPK